MAFDDLELPSGSARDVVGGSATYSAYAASSFTDVRVVAVVGDDFAAATLANMRARGIDTQGVERASGRTFRWAGRYDADLAHRTTLDTQLNVFAEFRPKIPAEYRETPLVLLGNIHPSLQIEVLDQVARPKVVVADTMNFWIEGQPKALAELLGRIDILVINDEEARQLSGYNNIRRAAREIHARGPRRLIIKRGEHGALLFDEHGVFAAPGFPLEDVVDPTIEQGLVRLQLVELFGLFRNRFVVVGHAPRLPRLRLGGVGNAAKYPVNLPGGAAHMPAKPSPDLQGAPH